MPHRVLDGPAEEVLERFRRQARVADLERGYIHAPWVNLDIDARLQGQAAGLIAQRFQDRDVSRVVGIPVMGVPLATAVAERMGLPLVPARKDGSVPAAWSGTVLVEGVSSFTTGQTATFAFNGAYLSPGDHLLLVDDFCAHGTTGLAIVRAFLERGYRVSLAVYCAKLFQGGLGRIGQLGVETYHVVGIRGLSADGGLELA